MTYEQAQQALREAKQAYAEKLSEFSACAVLDLLTEQELSALVTRLYDEFTHIDLSAEADGVHKGMRTCHSFQTPQHCLDESSVYYLAERSWRFIYQCESLYLSCLAGASGFTFLPDTRYELSDSAAPLVKKCRDIFIEKNRLYGNTFLKEGVPGILTRLGDKLARLKSLQSQPGSVDESLEDTYIDTANYAILAAISHKLSKACRLPDE